MRKSPTLLLLAGLQLLAAISLGAICYLQVRYAQELNDQNARVLAFNTNRQFIMSLVNDCTEYSKKNPAIDPILASIGVKTARAAAPPTAPPAQGQAPKPAAKPGTR